MGKILRARPFIITMARHFMSRTYDPIEGLKVLYELSTLIRSDSTAEEKFIRALAKVRDMVGCHSASLFVWNGRTGKLEESATVGQWVDLIETIDFDMGQGFSAWVAKQRRSVLIPSLRKNHPDGFRSFVSVPLIWGEKLIGVMNFGHNEPAAFTEEHVQFLEVSAMHLAYTIERTLYEKELIAKNTAIIKAQEEIKKQQARIIEMEKFQVLGQMAASINHEINNPLTTIIGNVDLILISSPDLNPLVRKKLTVILNEANRIAEIVKKIRSIKQIVIGEYIRKTGESMLDIDSSSDPNWGREKLSPPEELADPSV
jgi:signal transduction histidine kinase